MSEEFSTQIDRFVVDTEQKMLFVLRDSLKAVTDEANKNKRDGGKVPILTGFLWSSAGASLNRRPSGPTKGDKKLTYTWNVTTVVDALARMKIGDVFYFGWTAEYARAQEIRNGFLRSAIMNWQMFVNAAVAKVKK